MQKEGTDYGLLTQALRRDKTMRIPNIKGEYFFKALRPSFFTNTKGWDLTELYFKDIEEAKDACGPNVIWPVEINCDGYCFVPDEEEFKE